MQTVGEAADHVRHFAVRYIVEIFLIVLVVDVMWSVSYCRGVGTALRLLYAPDRELVKQSLQRNHIVALVNALGRVSHSVDAARVVVPLLQHAQTTGLNKISADIHADDQTALDQLECHMDHGGVFGV